MKLLDFYRDCAELARRDLVKQKMLLPLESITELCNQHHRQHRSVMEKLLSGEEMHKIYAIQKAYPRTGTVRADFDALALARQFESQKADALAVVTEKHFYCGEPSILTGVTHMVNLPIIRWDFIVDAYQIIQSRLWGADAVRIIVPLLDQTELTVLYRKAVEQKLEVIWELHSPADAERIAEFIQSGSIAYIDNDCLTAESIENILKILPQTAPALLDEDKFELLKTADSRVNGVIKFAPQDV